jgi:hypothetical protein
VLGSGWWRRPLLLWLLIGCTVSALAAGRFVPRLLIDGAISFAFIPLLELVAFIAVCRGSARGATGTDTFEEFCRGDAVWFWWLAALSAVSCLVPSRPFIRVILPLELSAVAPFVLSWRSDLRFFRVHTGSSPQAAVLRVLMLRVIAWGAGIAYFFGIALWSDQLPALWRWIAR